MQLQNIVYRLRHPTHLTGPAARLLGGLGGTRDYTPFIILARSRTGSNMLVDALDSHPRIHCENERLKRLDGRQAEDALNDVYPPVLPLVKAVGFKIFYYHPSDATDRAVWDRLVAMKNLHVIHLTRWNLLRVEVSRQIAGLKRQWGIMSEDERPAVEERRVTLDPAQLQTNFEDTHRKQAQARELFRNHPLLETTYRDIVADLNAEVRRITDFLGLSYHRPHIRFIQQNPEPLPELVANYAELKAHFAGTQWEAFFID